MTLKELKVGEEAQLLSVGGDGALRRHFLDMGLIPGVEVKVVKLAPMGDPMELMVRDYLLTLRLADASQIEIVPIERPINGVEEDKNISMAATKETLKEASMVASNDSYADHPGLGEGGVHHDKSKAHPLPVGTQLTFALAGNQNSGKTTLFNALTGSNQHVGNFPGVTVDRKDGVILGHSNTLITDLPGIYSLSPYSGEELVTRNFLLHDSPKGIINIIDATNIERNLYLTLQLLELGIPMVVALNMMDEVHSNGGSIRVNVLEGMLGVPVIPISAVKGEGIEELIDHAIHVAQNGEAPERNDFCSPMDNNGAVHRCIHALEHLIEDHCDRCGLPMRFAATKLAEGDNQLLSSLLLDPNEIDTLNHIIQQLEEERGLDAPAAIADMRYSYIDKICQSAVIKPQESRERRRSERIDKILTGRFTAHCSFLVIMAFIFWITFGPIGKRLSQYLEQAIDFLCDLTDKGLSTYGINPVVKSLVTDGIFAGVGSVLSFLPYIVILFFFLSILEDSGYMARVAFIMDRPLRKIGLSGRSIVPMLIGFGCTVPAVMSARTLSSERDRKMTIMLTPFMSCSAKLPVFALFSAAFFPQYAAIVMIGLYVLGIVMAIVVAAMLRHSMFRGTPVPFVMELPAYRLPGVRNVAQLLWSKAKDFITKAFTIIFTASVIIWFLQTFDLKLNISATESDSILTSIASLIAPIFKPLGFADWRISTALLTGFVAKESIVSTLTVLASGASLVSLLSPIAAVALLVFILIYTPCVAAISAVKRELGVWWSIGVVVGQCIVAYIVAYLVYIIGLSLF